MPPHKYSTFSNFSHSISLKKFIHPTKFFKRIYIYKGFLITFLPIMIMPTMYVHKTECRHLSPKGLIKILLSSFSPSDFPIGVEAASPEPTRTQTRSGSPSGVIVFPSGTAIQMKREVEEDVDDRKKRRGLIGDLSQPSPSSPTTKIVVGGIFHCHSYYSEPLRSYAHIISPIKENRNEQWRLTKLYSLLC